ncbi:MAG TPA: asparagine synthase (glutamine-hydrolyzing) [Terriglobales bacterium]
MCGIAGIVSADPSVRISEGTLRRMCDVIRHRGPDDEGILVKNGTALGMRRLSIIDVAGGHQPVFNEDQSIWIVFNGEIYNFPQLRPELEARGHRFRTHTDTEVIVHLYEDLGVECVKQLRGMFAFALYDQRKGRLLLVRDRLGKKPLHYALDGSQLLFGSEIKSILSVAPHLSDPDPQALLQYLHFGYIPNDRTAFKQIHKLPAGHLLEYQDGRTSVRQYWDLPEFGTHSPGSEEECVEELEHRLEECVRMRLISDVPLGALLSGGTDSSTVVALMARASSKPVRTFSIGFENEEFNEAPFARKVAERFGTEHHELILNPDVVQTVESLTRSWEEPFGDSSMLPTYYVSCLARKHVTVALAGDGGDEIFAGYDRYRVHAERAKFDLIPEWLKRSYREQLYPRLPRDTRGRGFLYNISLPAREHFVDLISFLPRFERDIVLLSEDFRRVATASGSPEAVMYGYFDSAPAQDVLSRLLYLDAKTYLVEDILAKVDRMSMATSLEVRAPLLDHQLVEWVTGLRPKWKMRGREQKYLLRRLAERVGVPREVLYRPKRGFAIPLVHWIRYELKNLILTVLLEPRTLQRGYFRPEGVRRLLDEHFSGRRNHSDGIWRLLIFELWHRNFLEQIGTPEFLPSHTPTLAVGEGVV